MLVPPSDTLSRQPTVPSSQLRHVPVVVMATVIVVAAIAAMVIFLKARHDVWPAFGWTTGFAVLIAVVSVTLISRSADKPVEHFVTMSMLLAVIRIAISLGGLLVCVFVLHTPMIPTAALVGAYFASMLIVESVLVRGALSTVPQGPTAPQSTEMQGKQG